MNSPRSRTTAFRMLTLLATSVALLAACSPTAEPTPTPTPAFANEAEAFAAAEEVYRAYNAASNGEGDTRSYLTGGALESDIETTRYLEEQNLTLVGSSEIISFSGIDAELHAVSTIRTEVCLDVTDSRVLDARGKDVTPPERADRWLLEVTLSGTAEALLISGSIAAEDRAC